jgi:hypothetical protein
MNALTQKLLDDDIEDAFFNPKEKHWNFQQGYRNVIAYFAILGDTEYRDKIDLVKSMGLLDRCTVSQAKSYLRWLADRKGIDRSHPNWLGKWWKFMRRGKRPKHYEGRA